MKKQQYLALNWKGLAIAFGLFWGGYLALAALLASVGLRTMWFSPETFNMLVSLYPGYSTGVLGTLVGLAYGFVCGTICGAILAWLYNWATFLFS